MVEVVFLGLNSCGERVYNWLVDRDDADVLALVTEKSQLEIVPRLQPSLLVASGFRHIVPPDILECPSLGSVNLHPSYLPYNRGANTNVWSIIEEEPAGVSLHYMTAEIDQGPIIARRELSVHPNDTGRSLYDRLESALVELFRDNWSAVRDGTADTIPQSHEAGTSHTTDEFSELFEIDLDERVSAGNFIDRLRALTYPPYDNAFFEIDGHRYYVDISITPEDETGDETIHWNVPSYDS